MLMMEATSRTSLTRADLSVDGRAGFEAGQEMPTTIHGNSKLPARKRFRGPAPRFCKLYSCTNTAFFAFRCFANASKLPRVEGMRTGFPLNIL
jgi:hypothetical protein